MEADEVGKLRASTDREAAARVGLLKDVVEDAELCAAVEIRDVCGWTFQPD